MNDAAAYSAVVMILGAGLVAIGLVGIAYYVAWRRLARLARTSQDASREELTELHGVTRALAESEARKTAIVESALDAIITMNHEGHIIEFNPAAESMFGYTRAEMIGRPMGDAIIPPAYRERHRQGLARYLASGEARVLNQRLELSALRADGVEFPVELAITRIPLPGPPMFTGYIRDITGRKRSEQALKLADRRKDEFLAVLAHELRNPLAPIRNGVELMRQIGLTDPNLVEVRDMLERQVEQIVRLVDDLLDVSRITRGKIRLQKQTTDLATVLTRALEISRPHIEARRHKPTLSLPSEPLWLDADPARLAQVFANLLNNAAKYTKQGGDIALSAARENEHIIVRLRDTGIGIAPEMLPRVFDMFTQADETLARSEGGLGIGLTLVRGLVEMHGGRVQVFSEGLGQGSEFVVQLPLISEHQAVPGSAAPSAIQTSSTPRRVLVIDDNRDSAASLAQLLTRQGHDVRVAYDGPNGLKEANSFDPEIVLLDIGLPGMDGYEVAPRLRALPGLAHVQLVAMTGYGQDEARRRAAETGFDAHLLKPVDLAILQELLQGGAN